MTYEMVAAGPAAWEFRPMDTPSTIAPPATSPDAGEADLLLAFVRERDVPCPRCDYNLRNLTTPVCPECREPLTLKVGVQRVPILPLLLTEAPGAFCAIAFGLFLTMCVLHGPPPVSQSEVWLTATFLALSGIGAVALAICHRWFLCLGIGTQRTTALIVWLAHLAAFMIFMQHV